MKRFAFISDVIFTFFVGDVITLVLFRYLGVSLPLALFLSAVCGGLTALGVGSLLRVRRKNLFLKKSDEAQKRKFLLHLSLLSDESRTEYMQTLLSTPEAEVKRFGKLRIFNQDAFYFLKFTLSPLTADEIPALARLKTGKRKILLCAQIEESAKDLCDRLDIEVYAGDWVYARAKAANALPTEYLGEAPPRAKRRFKLWFSRKNAKRFLVGGALVLLLSRITPFYLYYLLLGGCLVIASVFIRVFGAENE